MQIRVLFFGVLKDLTGKSAASIDLPDGSTARDAASLCATQYPRIEPSLHSVAIAVNHEYASPDAVLHANDEVALLPPVSGGAGHAVIVHAPIDTATVLRDLKQGEDGAAVVFEGVVRNHTRGRRTLYLDYEAYEVMALQQMERLAAQALQQFQVRDVALVHRLGRLQISEISVLIAVASAHRAPAFEACRWLIDTLKRTVPIWKKEYFEDGAVWADGEMPPAPLETRAAKPAS